MSNDRRALSGRSEFWIVVACVLVFCAGQLFFQRMASSVGSTVLYVCFLCLLGAPLFWILPRNNDIGWLEYGIVSIAFVGMALVPTYSLPWWIDSLVFTAVVCACLQLARLIKHLHRSQEEQGTKPPTEDAGPGDRK